MKRRQSMKYLPEEVIGEILLSNVPIKSLLRFKSVSKSWRSLICSPKFVRDHLNRSRSDRMLIGTFNSKQIGLTLRSWSFNSLLDEPNRNDVVRTWYHHCPTTENTDLSSIKFVGSCNGLVLIKFNKYSLFLWNPSTRRVKTIPPPSASDQLVGLGHFTYGFGYDDSTDDYKVVCIRVTKTLETKIYSVRTGSWKRIDNSGNHILSDFPCKFVNGKFHWPGFKGRVYSIISLSLEEKYQVVALPESFSERGHLEDWGGYLCMICYSMGDNGARDINIWAMMKYGVVESWTRIWRLRNFDYPTCKPFWLTKNGDIFVFFTQLVLDVNGVLTESEVVVVYNGNNKLREYRIGRDELQDSFKLGLHATWVYVGSLVSP